MTLDDLAPGPILLECYDADGRRELVPGWITVTEPGAHGAGIIIERLQGPPLPPTR